VLVAQDEISVYEREADSWRYRTLDAPGASLAFAVGGATMTLAEIYDHATVAG
jgi:hypothetical protein